jgi:cytochrome P450
VPPTKKFPLGAAVTLDELERDPHPILAALRAREPVSWVPAYGGWLVSRYDLALAVMRDPDTFTVDDPRFSTAQVIGPSMLSLDGSEHARHRAPFIAPYRVAAVRDRFSGRVAARAHALVDALAPAGRGELRRAYAGPLAAAVMAAALGLEPGEEADLLGWYDAIVASVTSITAGDGPTPAGREAFAALRSRLGEALTNHASTLGVAADSLTEDEIASNAAVLLFGGIETTEGMICNAAVMVLADADRVALVRREPARLDTVIEESLRLEPAAAVIDRYATADTVLSGAPIARGELVRISIAGANRDPDVFDHPDRFDLDRSGSRRHLAFAQGPHVCVGVHLARLETRIAIATLLERLPAIRLDPRDPPPRIRGLVFRKPAAVQAVWG